MNVIASQNKLVDMYLVLGIVLLVLVSAKESVTITSAHFCGSEIEQSMNQHIIHRKYNNRYM